MQAVLFPSSYKLFLPYCLHLCHLQSERLGSWYPVILITIFNFSDFIGKNIPLCGVKPSPNLLLVLALARGAVLLPLFTVARRFTGPVGPGVMGVLTIALGFTNG